MENMFHVGQEIVCVNDSFPRFEVINIDLAKIHYPQIKLPKKNISYTIRGFNEKGAIYLEEIRNIQYTFLNGLAEPAFRQFHFVSLQRLEQGEELSNKLLKDIEEEINQQVVLDCAY